MTNALKCTSVMAVALLAACVSGRGSGTGTNTGSMGTSSTTGTTSAATGTTSSTTGTTGSMTSSTTGTTTTTSGGDVDLANGGLWSDGTGSGFWMDTSGAMRWGGRNGQMMGLQAATISRMSNANIVAHLATGDSLEVQLSQAVLARAQNQSVRDFAQRMITEHTQHMQQGRQLAMQNGITPAPAPGDTIDVAMATRMLSRITSGNMGSMNMSNSTSSTTPGSTSGNNSGMSGTSGDRQLMGAEVAMHRHMLHELTLMQPQASGAARTLVDQTIPVVRQHLTDAESIWRQVGGGMGQNGSGSR